MNIVLEIEREIRRGGMMTAKTCLSRQDKYWVSKSLALDLIDTNSTPMEKYQRGGSFSPHQHSKYENHLRSQIRI